MTEDRQLWVWYTPFGLGGVETFLLNYARTVSQSGVRIAVAGVSNLDGPLRAAYQQASIRVLDWTGFYPPYMGEVSGRDICDQLARDVAEFCPTLLSINGCTDFATGTVPFLRRLKPYCTIVDIFHINPPDDEHLDLRAPYVDVLDGMVSSNASALDRFRARFRAAQALPTRYIPYGTNVPAGTRRQPTDELRLLYVGRLVQEQKRILELPDVLSRLAAFGRRFKLTIVGQGAQEAELRAALEERSLLEFVEFAGYVAPERILDYYLRHDLLINVSNYEGFAISIIEALAAGCVPVCTELAGLDRDFFIDGVTCRLCPIDDLPQMAGILRDLSVEEITRMSAAAQDAGSALTIPRMVDRYQQFIAELHDARPVQVWPDHPAIEGEWDLSQRNPWLPHPHPLKQWARRALAWVK